jgi:DNA repair protein SbcC/Rad50
MQAGLRDSVYTMFENLFKKTLRRNPIVKAQRETSPPPVGKTPPQTNAKTSPDDQSEQMQHWRAKIHAAAPDEAALLQLAYQAPTVDLKLAALQALMHEDSFKQAMHEFREQDKRLYRAAKSHWQAARDRRVASDEANASIAAARALLQQEQVPANRLVELERRWTALNSELLEAALPAEFAALRAQLSAKVRAHSEQTRSLSHWLHAVDGALETLGAILPGVAKGDTPPAEAQTLAVSVLELLAKVPDTSDARCSEKTNLANGQRALAASVAQRAQFLHSLPASGVADQAHEKAMIEQWRAFPELSEGGEAPLHGVLAQRFADWRNAGSDARKREQDVHRSQERAQRALQQELRLDAIQRHIEAAEAAHAGGRVAELAGVLATIDRALKRGSVSAALSGVLTQRIEFLRREHVRLQDWQRWSGGLGREQLAAEALELARLATGNIAIKAHAEAISKRRERWKELDKLGGASNQSVWLTFDGALKSAYEPVAAHQDKLKRARLDNLAARDQIIAELITATAKFFPVAQEGVTPAPDVQPDWRTIARTLEQTRIAWQKLGPVEHTVPRGALQGDSAVATRYVAAVQALDAPLTNAYADARRQREQLIRAATDLGGSASSAGSARDVVEKVQKLQAQWQAAAKALPLPRGDENALWAAFKSGIDAVFAARDAARVAKDAESSAQLKAREEIVDRLAAIASSSSASDIKRALAEADSAWRAGANVAKPLQAKLDSRYHAARDAVRARLEELAQRVSQARFDDLITAMGLCHEREIASDSHRIGAGEAADLETRWNAISNLPDAWKAPLEARFRGMSARATNALPAAPSGETADASMLDALLNLEAACGIDSPSDFRAARQHLKMRALKSAMEARQSPANTPADIERWLLEIAAYPRPDERSRDRLAKIIATLRLGRPN